MKFFQYKKKSLQFFGNVVIIFIFCHFFPFNIEISKMHIDFLTNHIFRNIYKVTYQYLWPKA